MTIVGMDRGYARAHDAPSVGIPYARPRYAALEAMSTPPALDPHRLARLLDVGRGVLSELDLDIVLDRVLETAMELTGARYAAVGVLDEERRGLSRFLTRGVDEQVHRAIGDLPQGRGVLGVLIDHPHPLRLSDVGEHPRSYGFPPGHPPMRTFLGVPILVRGEAWGNLYLTEKAGGEEFSALDEDAVVVLADWAAIAIDNARLYLSATGRRDELERAVRGLEATAAVARAVGAETDLNRVLELVVKRGRALIDARDVLILLREGDELVVAAGAGYVSLDEPRRVAVAGSTSGEVLAERRSRRLSDAAAELLVPAAELGVAQASTALLVPLLYRGEALGVLVAFDHLGDDASFTYDDQTLLESFAAQAATAVATAQTVATDRLRRSLEASEAERRRWARELHDETLQALGALKVLLSGAMRLDDVESMRARMRDAVDQLTHDIESLRGLIAELRPPALDQLGLAPALASLAQRTAVTSGLEVRTSFELPEGVRPAPDIETAVYRIVQESLTNVAKHARADAVDVSVRCEDREVHIAVADDGVGFDAQGPTDGGFGLTGMRERVELAGGELEIGPGTAGGTLVRARLPLR
jgi:signal transduction histidine kinase